MNFSDAKKISMNQAVLAHEKKIEEKFCEEMIREGLYEHCKYHELKLSMSPTSPYDDMEVVIEGTIYRVSIKKIGVE